ncbi:uncharacterized protein LOC127711328 isoform X1 [Mytilus californianus]|uniref:uncharacterized protein LOC127711328 isoform X1 n=1 Tax=Mytilus californianus TaxID=6549 RepID=UPI002245DB9E|nr:uncharacterized protein LOC127711328 isoform X1 [Mytilus californianus]
MHFSDVNMDLNDQTRGSTYSSPLSQFLRHSREVVEDMEQPLDLSQRESAMEKKVLNIDMEEPICQFTNCSCPLKHILSLDSNDSQINAGFRPRCETVSSGDYPRSQFQKRLQEQSDSVQDHFHPKRRKIEQYKQNISRSSSDTNLYGYGGPTDPFRSFTNYSGEDMSQRKSPEHKYQPYWKSSQTYTATNTYPSSDSIDTTPSSDVKVIPKHAERLPKKRSHARNLSYDHSFLQHSGNDIKSSRTPSPQSMSNDAEMSQGVVIEDVKPMDHINLPELTSGPKVHGEELRASILKELRDEKDDEDVDEFRKRFFGSLFSRAKSSANKGKTSALDILISDKCKDDIDFRPRNSHIDQILRGEKQGKLCLMDIVELQVEIGLA